MNRNSLRLLVPLALLVLLFSAMAQAQDEACEIVQENAFDALVEACSSLEAGNACTVEGDTIALDGDLSAAASPALLRLPGETGDIDVMTVGDVTVASYERDEPAQLQVTNNVGYAVNLRGGPGTSFGIVGTFGASDTAAADGRNANNEWVRLALQDSAAWVAASLVALDGDIQTLPVVEGTSPAPSTHALVIEPGETACADNLSGVLLTTTSETPQQVTLNDAAVTFTGAAFAAFDADALTLYAFTGEATISSGDTAHTLTPGDAATAGADAPQAAFLPLDFVEMLPVEPDVCLIAVEEIGASLDLLAQPRIGAAVEQTIESGASYPVGLQSTEGGTTWWRLTSDAGGGWLRPDDVQSIGRCDRIPELAQEQAQESAAPAGDANASSGAPAASNVTPPEQIMYAYLLARVAADAGQMQALSCSAWDGQAALQAQSFRAMRAELQGVSCSTVQQGETSAIVSCGGQIQTEYNGETRQWPLGSYQMTLEGGQWRMCGEA